MKISKKNIFLGTSLVFVVWIFSAIIIHYCFSSPEDRGTFGDMFGAINSLFSGLALFGIIISILIQQNELNLQRKELKDTRLEFKTNRITTIMFKQLDYLNSIIDKAVFNDSISSEQSKTRIDEFVYSIDRLYLDDKRPSVEKLINENQIVIRGTSVKVISILDGLDNLFQTYNLDKLESKQMRKIFKTNISPSFLKLLFYRSLFVQQVFSEDSKIKPVGKITVESEKKQYIRISKFGEEE